MGLTTVSCYGFHFIGAFSPLRPKVQGDRKALVASADAKRFLIQKGALPSERTKPRVFRQLRHLSLH